MPLSSPSNPDRISRNGAQGGTKSLSYAKFINERKHMTPVPAGTPESRLDTFLSHFGTLLKILVPLGEVIANDHIKNQASKAKAAAIETDVNQALQIGQ